LNALDPDTYQRFSDACIDIRDDDNTWVAIITGEGDKAFCSGSDLKKSIPQIMIGDYKVPPSIRKGLQIYKPFIAAVNGVAIGGGVELALACDIRIAAEEASFTVAEAKWGLMPGQGGTQRLPRTVGLSKAAELMFMAKTIDSQEAYRIGLVNTVVPRQELMSTAIDWANNICENSPLAVRMIKEAITRGLDLPLNEALHFEDTLLETLFGSEDAREGIKAFMEKRKPLYKGK
jgi:enoyl-CoA hydratase/carnithine racemase